MQITTITTAITEAERFLERAKHLQRLIQEHEGKSWYFNEPKPQGALRRSSMDLTRVLAELRAGK